MCPISDCFNGYCYIFSRKVSPLPPKNQFTEKLNHLDETFLVTSLLRSIGVVAGGTVKTWFFQQRVEAKWV